jgi:hypothetical protein
MLRIRLSNILFLIPALVIGPVLLIALIVHGIILDRIHVTRRWFRQRAARVTARVCRIGRYPRPSTLRQAVQRSNR